MTVCDMVAKCIYYLFVFMDMNFPFDSVSLSTTFNTDIEDHFLCY